jgi:hypothetical protein
VKPLQHLDEQQKRGTGDRLATLQMREADIRAKIAAEQERLRKREARETERLYRMVGETCCKAAQRPELAELLKDILETETDERARDFLRQKGLL